MKSLLIAAVSILSLGACTSLSTYKSESVCLYSELSERSVIAQEALGNLGLTVPLGSKIAYPQVQGQSYFDLKISLPADVQALELPENAMISKFKPCEATEAQCIAEITIRDEVIQPGSYTNPLFNPAYKEVAKIRAAMDAPLSEHVAKVASNESIELCQFSSNRTFDSKPLESFQ